MSIKVLKYGGSSVSTTQKIKSIAKNLVSRCKENQKLIVVVSAMGNTTDELINLSKEISPFPDKRDLDLLISTGEQVSISLLSMAIKSLGKTSIALTGFQAGIETDDFHTKARIENISTKKINSYLKKYSIIIIAGFQGMNSKGDITTLGRGGSDTSAVALASALNAECCEIYTDVDGIYSVDPNIYPKAKKIPKISFKEMLELSSLGASVLETRAVELAHKNNIKLYLALNSGEIKGTYIKEFDQTMEKNIITGMSIDDNCIMVSITNLPYIPQKISEIFMKLANNNINVDMISQTAPYLNKTNISFTAPKTEKNAISKTIENLIESKYEINTNLIKLSVVGIGMVSSPGVAAKLFDILSSHNIPFYQVTTSEISISYTIDKEHQNQAIQLIARKFNL